VSEPGSQLIQPGTEAPQFTLPDQDGQQVSLSDFRGQPVVLAFLYTGCPDLCRLTTAGLAEAARELGPAADGVAFVGVSVDPAGDDPAAVRRYLARYALSERMLYLTGPAEALRPVWESYHLFVNTARTPGLEAHTDALFVLDRAGRERALLRSDFDPSELASGLRALLRERW
jgi:protein SCO1/2